MLAGTRRKRRINCAQWYHRHFTRAGVQSIWKGYRRSSAESAEGGRIGEAGCSPSPENFGISYVKIVGFYAFPVIIIDTVLFKKGTLIKRTGVRDTLDPPRIRPCIIDRLSVQARRYLCGHYVVTVWSLCPWLLRLTFCASFMDVKRAKSRNLAFWTNKRNSQFWTKFRRKLKFWTKLVTLTGWKIWHFGQDIFCVSKHAVKSSLASNNTS